MGGAEIATMVATILGAVGGFEFIKWLATRKANGTRTLREQITLYPNGGLAQIVGMLQSFPRLTKEQFYSLD